MVFQRIRQPFAPSRDAGAVQQPSAFAPRPFRQEPPAKPLATRTGPPPLIQPRLTVDETAAGATEAPTGQVQRVFDLIVDGKPLPKKNEGDEEKIADLLLQALKKNKLDLKQYDSEEEADTIDDYLGKPRLREEILRLLRKTTDYGEVDVANNQQLGFFYLKLKQQLDPKQRKGQLESAGDEGRARAQDFIDKLNFKSYDELVRHSVGVWEGKEQVEKIEKVYKTALLGRGATIAYYISDNLANIDVGNSILIGEEQPWRKTRGSAGVINHPMNMIAPKYQGRPSLDEEGLAGRQEFSNELDKVIKDSGIESIDAKVSSVKKQGYATKYYRIETADGEVYYAQHVVVGLGIGKHAVPKDVKEKKELIGKAENALPNKMPRVMDMDQFQAALSDETLEPGTDFKTMIIAGPNAAIDVATTAIRKGIEASWLATNPAFLPGTDNVYAEMSFQKAFGKSKDLIKKDGNLTFYRYYYEKVDVSEGGVAVGYCDREKNPAGTIKADLLVYGLGPDSAELSAMFKVAKGRGKDEKLPLEAMYDINQHFNYTPTSANAIQQAVIDYFKLKNAKKEIYDLDKIESALEQTNGIVKIEDIERTQKQESMFKTPVSQKLPGVVGLKAKKDDKWDESSLEILGGTAFRLGADVKYAYVSDTLQGLLDKDLAKLLEANSGLVDKSVTDYLGEAKKHLGVAAQLAKKIEDTKNEDFNKGGEGKAIADLKLGIGGMRGLLDKIPKVQQRIFEGNYGLIRNAVDMLDEYFVSRQLEDQDQYAANHMLKVPKTLPKNVLLSDQLTATRSSVEAATDEMPAEVEKGVNFITSNNTVIAAHIASAYGDIPPALADYLTAHIIYDRRHLPLEKAPLPEPDDLNNVNSTFNIKKQAGFQKSCKEQLEKVNALWDMSKIEK